MKRQTVILATLLIAVFATATIFAEVAAAQQPIAPTTKITTVTKDNQNLRSVVVRVPPYRPIVRPPIYPGPIIRPPIYPPIYPIYPPIIVTPPIYFPII